MQSIAKFGLVIGLVLFQVQGHAVPSVQDSLTNNNYRFIVRGKVAAFFIIEDWFFRTGTIGGEVVYKNKHSVGADFTVFRWRTEFDDDYDRALYENFEKRVYGYLDYKYVFGRIKTADIYLNVYDKFGTYRMWYDSYDRDRLQGDISFLETHASGTFNEQGLGLGVRQLMDYEHFGFDVSANMANRFSTTSRYTAISATQSVDESNVKSRKLGFYMRLNFFYSF